MTAPDHPPTIFVVHPKEKRSKCTIEPLRGRAGFVFWKHPKPGREPLENYVRLGIGGPVLSHADRSKGLLLLDGTWRLAASMEQEFERAPLRSLPAWETAYPRTSKLFDDPIGGLATIEALYVAHMLLGRETDSLLDSYHWADEFLALNRDRLNAGNGPRDD